MDWLWFIWYIYIHIHIVCIYICGLWIHLVSRLAAGPQNLLKNSVLSNGFPGCCSLQPRRGPLCWFEKNRRRLSQAMAVDCEFYLFTSVLKHSYLESLLVPSHRLRRASISSAPFHSHARAHQHWEALSAEVLHCCLDDCLHRFWCRGCLEVQALALGRPQEQSAWSVYSSLAPAIGCGLVPMWTALQDMTCICGGFSIPPKSWLHGQASHL